MCFISALSQVSQGFGDSRSPLVREAEEGDDGGLQDQGGGRAQGPPQVDRGPGPQPDAGAGGDPRDPGGERGGRGERQVAQLHPGQGRNFWG